MEGLYKQIGITKGKKELVCLVGSGGKTSTMFRLGRELAAEGWKVLITTTTAIYYPHKEQYDQIILTGDKPFEALHIKNSCPVTVMGRTASDEGKLLGVSPEFLDAVFLKDIFDYILIEGDGSKGRPIKAPAGHEPVIPALATKVLGLIGLDSIGRRVCGEYVHRPEIFCRVTGCSEGDVIDTAMVSRLISHEEGLFIAVPASAERYLVLNKADSEREKAVAAIIVKKLADMGYKTDGILITSMREVKE